MRVLLSALAAIALSACASLSDRASASLAAPGLEGTRWGLVVTTMDGRELIAIRPNERFSPASNTKLFTVAAAFHRLGDLTVPDPAMGTSVRLEAREGRPPDIVLVGGGDAMLIDAADCERDCLSDLADAVVANGITRIGAIIADDQLYPHQPWGYGWSQEDMIKRSGEPVSALTVNNNETMVVVRPAATASQPAIVEWLEPTPWFPLLSDIETIEAIEGNEAGITVERVAKSSAIRVYGRVLAGGAAVNVPVAVDDPARVAALRFQRLLAERGVEMGAVIAGYRRDVTSADTDTKPRPHVIERQGVELARLVPPPLIEDVTFLMKQSQNLHAELLLRRLGLIEGGGSTEDGLSVVNAMLTEARAERFSWDFADGSGMSIYNRVTPRMVANFLRWTSQQTWGEAFRATLPVGGVDGTLRRRFAGTSLEGRISAKTGTLAGVNALSGFMTTRSGQTLIFSAFANDRPPGADSTIVALDATLVEIAETN